MMNLWTNMGGLFGAKFINQFGEAGGSAFEIWCKAVADLSPEQIKTGFQNLCNDHPKYVPDALEFREYCVDVKNFGLPEDRAAYIEAMKHCHEWRTYAFSHPAVRAALRESNVTLMKSLSEKQSARIFYRNYKIICRRVIAGLPFEKKMPLAIEQPSLKVCTQAENRAHMKQLKKEMGL